MSTEAGAHPLGVEDDEVLPDLGLEVDHLAHQLELLDDLLEMLLPRQRVHGRVHVVWGAGTHSMLCWCGMVPCVMVRYGMVCHCMVWYG